MGEMAEREWELWGMEKELSEQFGPHYWRTKDGTRIDMREMEDGHLVNTIRWIERNEEAIRLGMLLRLGPGPSGDHASEAFDNVVRELAEEELEYLMPSYGYLLREWERRLSKFRVPGKVRYVQSKIPAFSRWVHLSKGSGLLCRSKIRGLDRRYSVPDVEEYCPRCLFTSHMEEVSDPNGQEAEEGQ